MTDNIVYYQGSRLLEGLSDYTPLNIDQLNFVVSQLVALVLAGLYRTKLGPTKVSSKVRQLFGLVFGVWMSYFCFGSQALHLAGLPAICYLVLLTQNPSIIHTLVLFIAMLYLSIVHLHRQIFEDKTIGLDISGPLMVITQKVTSLAFSLHDGLIKKEEDLTETQKFYAVKQVPTVLEFFSYTLMFPSLMAGPVIFYQDYINFISTPPSETPNPTPTVLKKLTIAIACALIFVMLLPKFPISRLKEETFLQTNFCYKLWYLTAATTLVRAKYYFAWSLADSMCNNAGLGWTGESWSKFSNIDIWGFEFSLSLKESIDAWNRGTNQWLRFIVYRRVHKYSTLSVFALSALWHGFYPGYYLTFLGGALFTFASRTMRRLLRPYFLTSKESKLFYDVSTFVVTRIAMAYITFPFVLLEFWGTVVVYHGLYWVLHLLALAAVFVAPHVIQEIGQKNGFAKALGPYSDAVGKID